MKGTHTRARLLWSLLLSLVMAASGWSPSAIAYAIEGDGTIQPADPVVEVQTVQEDKQGEGIEAVDPDITPVEENGEEEEPVAPATENEEEEGPQLSAQADWTACIGNVGYESVQAAVTAANFGETVTILAPNITIGTMGVIVDSGKDITLDLNGCTIFGTPYGISNGVVKVREGGALTVVDNSAQGGGAIQNRYTGTDENSSVSVAKGASFVLESGTITSNKGVALYTQGDTNISGGTVEGEAFGIFNGTGGTVTISGLGDGAPIITSDGRSVATSTYTSGTFTINGGRYSDDEGNGDDFTRPEGQTLMKAEGEEYYELHIPVTFDADNVEGDSDVTTVYVKNGDTVTKPDDPANGTHGFLGWFAEGSEKAFDFSTPITEKLTLTAHWGEAVAYNIQKDKYYASLGDASSDASNDGTQTIQLVADVTYTGNGYLAIGNRNYTLDLNGHTLSSERGDTDRGTIWVYGGSSEATLKVIDSSEGQTGKIEQRKNGGNGIYVQGTLVLESGSVESAGDGIRFNGWSLTVNGGTVSGVSKGINWAGFTQGSLKINGGTVKSATAGGSLFSAESNFKAYINGGQFSDDAGNNADRFTLPAGQLLMKGDDDEYYTLQEAAARIGTTGYVSLRDAVDAAKDGDTVTMIKGVALGSYTLVVDGDRAITLDLNGHDIIGTDQLSIPSSDSTAVRVESPASLTVKDSSQGGKIVNECVSSDAKGVYVESGASFTLESGSIESMRGAGIDSDETGVTITISGGSVTCEDGSAVGVGGTLVVTGGTLSGLRGIVTDGVAEISGGEIYGKEIGVGSVNAVTVTGSGDSAPTITSGEGGKSVAVWDSSEDTFTINGGKYSDDEGNGEGFTLPEGMRLKRSEGEQYYTLQSSYADFGYSITLSDSIDITVNVKNLTQDPADYQVAYTFKGETTTAPLTDQTLNSFVVASCSAKEMIEPVEVEVSYQNQVIKRATLSIRSYCDSAIGKYGASQDDKERALADLCGATLDYGSYAQRALGYKTGDLANGGRDNFANAGIQVPESAPAVSGECDGIAGRTLSLMTTSKTQLVVYFKHEKGLGVDGYTFTVGGQPVDAVDANNKFAVTVEGISAKDLGKRYDIAVKDGDGHSMTVNVGPLDYVSMAVAKGGQPEVNRALYNYHLKAKAYLG